MQVGGCKIPQVWQQEGRSQLAKRNPCLPTALTSPGSALKGWFLALLELMAQAGCLLSSAQLVALS